ncbi:hypothetical protein ES703_95805 [subsurface metagenome]
MGIKIYQEPKLQKPDFIVGWPGIGNIGIIAVDTLRGMLRAEEFGEIESWDFFYPKKVFIKDGELKDMEFPGNKFYFCRVGEKDLMFFIGEEQPSEGEGAYARGEKAYHMANLVLDVALKFGCQRVYTSGAAVAPIHHTAKPRVWAVPNRQELIPEVSGYENTILMSDIAGRGGQGTITGLNGLLLGVARKRGLEGICLMGEIPVYLQGFSLPYPKASKSVVEVLAAKLGIEVDLSSLDDLSREVEGRIEEFYAQIPSEVKERLERLKYITYVKQEKPGPITEEDQKRIMEDIDRFFKKGGKED